MAVGAPGTLLTSSSRTMLPLPSTTQALHWIHRDINPGATGSGSLPQTTACGGSRMRAKLDVMPPNCLRPGHRLRPRDGAPGRGKAPGRRCAGTGAPSPAAHAPLPATRPPARGPISGATAETAKPKVPSPSRTGVRSRPLDPDPTAEHSHRLGNWRSWTASVRRRGSTPPPRLNQ